MKPASYGMSLDSDGTPRSLSLTIRETLPEGAGYNIRHVVDIDLEKQVVSVWAGGQRYDTPLHPDTCKHLTERLRNEG